MLETIECLVLVLLSVSEVRRGEGITRRRSITRGHRGKCSAATDQQTVVCITYKCGRYRALFIAELDGDDVLCRIEEEDDDNGPAPRAPLPLPKEPYYSSEAFSGAAHNFGNGKKGGKEPERRLSKGVKKATLSRGVSIEDFCSSPS